MDVVGHLKKIFETANPTIPVETTRIQPKALSANRYVFIQQQPGFSPVPGKQDDQQVEIVTYGQGPRAAVLAFSQSLIALIRVAWIEQAVTESGWIRSFEVNISPYLQMLPGIPDSTFRVTTTLTVRMRDSG